MKRLFFILCISVSGLVLLAGCKKTTYEEGLPSIEITSVTMIDDETAEVSASITSPGTSYPTYRGICYDLSPNPDVETNQTLADKAEKNFKVRVKLHHDDTYYIRAFASNDLGYTLTEDYKFTVPHPVAQTPPCKVADNKIKYGSYTYDAGYVDDHQTPLHGKYRVDAEGAGGVIVEFNEKPVNGVYTTCGHSSSFNHDLKTVWVCVGDWALEKGGKVYITENSDGTYKIEFCSIKTFSPSPQVSVSACLLMWH